MSEAAEGIHLSSPVVTRRNSNLTRMYPPFAALSVASDKIIRVSSISVILQARNSIFLIEPVNLIVLCTHHDLLSQRTFGVHIRISTRLDSRQIVSVPA